MSWTGGAGPVKERLTGPAAKLTVGSGLLGRECRALPEAFNHMERGAGTGCPSGFMTCQLSR